MSEFSARMAVMVMEFADLIPDIHFLLMATFGMSMSVHMNSDICAVHSIRITVHGCQLSILASLLKEVVIVVLILAEGRS